MNDCQGQNLENRRKHPRVMVRNGSWVWSEEANKPCQLIDISMGGLAFLYPSEESWRNDRVKLDIFIKRDKFHLGDIAITTISDCALPRDEGNDAVAMRRRGVQFDGLTEIQEAYLLEYLRQKKGGQAGELNAVGH